MLLYNTKCSLCHNQYNYNGVFAIFITLNVHYSMFLANPFVNKQRNFSDKNTDITLIFFNLMTTLETNMCIQLLFPVQTFSAGEPFIYGICL